MKIEFNRTQDVKQELYGKVISFPIHGISVEAMVTFTTGAPLKQLFF